MLSSRMMESKSINPTKQTPEPSRSMSFRAPQKRYTVNEFEFGKVLGIGSFAKPENILLTDDGHIKLADFGSARMMKPSGFIEQEAEEFVSTFIGSPEYLSPEVLNGHPLTIGADLWALGCIIYQMLEGKSPFRAPSEFLTFQKVVARDFVVPSHFTPEAMDLVNCLLNLDPKRRLAAGPMGYETLKAHPFFTGVNWGQLREFPAPIVPSLSLEAVKDLSDKEGLESDWELDHIGKKFSSANVDQVATLKIVDTSKSRCAGDSLTSIKHNKTSLPENCNFDQCQNANTTLRIWREQHMFGRKPLSSF